MEDRKDRRSEPRCPICGGHLDFWTAGHGVSVGCDRCNRMTMRDYPTQETAMEMYIGAAERYLDYVRAKEAHA